MKKDIHETAIISESAKIADNVKIGPYAVIEGNVTIGENTVIGAHSVIKEYTNIGKNNIIHDNVVLGDLPQDIHFDRNTVTFLEIGDNNEIREFANLHRASKENAKTIIKNNCYIMATGHVAHDCEINDNVIICNGALVAGHVKVGKGAFISGNCVVHQFCSIGEYAMISGMSAVGRDILPYALTAHAGEAIIYKLNLVGMRRAGFTSEQISQAEEAYDLWYNWNKTKQEFLDTYLNDNSLNDIAKKIVVFISESRRGITPRKTV
ncbi:acyl-ACP--UDP-N-acetylglucosamine O-acyltransferase [Brachyspira pilosicoli]|uniref:UDP-N-acetylglucosamine acyltransferase n=1 Tax=Brachyspira pilosicoli B2904 TaxID=1133568 RepID=J9URJ7_BRAPL|nr:acyl-ACP--UDP-N-acetylglucosamine O-acyltransferase [Brachyspira pilosicoli]AFR71485.1 UDP-N-acetylglucosamine acyltransferase [Brachyspira pilosicoli B2904]